MNTNWVFASIDLDFYSMTRNRDLKIEPYEGITSSVDEGDTELSEAEIDRYACA